MTIVLDNIRSAWNVGSIMRTCDAVGANLILIGYTPKPVGATKALIKKTAIGAEDTVPWQHMALAQEVLAAYPNACHLAIEISERSQLVFDFLKTHNHKLGEQDIFLWFGNEIHGIAPSLASQMTGEVHLPMYGMKESLNVANTVCAVSYLFLEHFGTNN